MKKILLFSLTIFILNTTYAESWSSGNTLEEVNVYSYRQPYLIEPILKRFTEKTGIKVNVLFAGKGLVDKMVQEGENSPADVLLTVDIGRLSSAVNSGVSQSFKSGIVDSNIPPQYRDPNGHWVGLTARARVIFASIDRVIENEITYEELADPKWKGRVCVRSGQNDYNLALFSSLIAHHGEIEATNWLRDLKANLARTPQGNDRDQVKGIYSGECDISIGNTYYMAEMRTNEKEPQQKEWAANTKIIMPNAEGRGTHMNLSGVLLARYAPNLENGIRLIEFLTEDVAQEMYADINYEYPLKAGVGISDMVASFGELNADTLDLITIANGREMASKMVDLVGFDE
jgi:iron(III) transport system substrate-binding protein